MERAISEGVQLDGSDGGRESGGEGEGGTCPDRAGEGDERTKGVLERCREKEKRSREDGEERKEESGQDEPCRRPRCECEHDPKRIEFRTDSPSPSPYQ